MKKFFVMLMALVLVIGLLPGHVHAESVLPTCEKCHEVNWIIDKENTELGMGILGCNTPGCGNRTELITGNDWAAIKAELNAPSHVCDYTILIAPADCQFSAYYQCECGSGKEIGLPDPDAHTFVNGVCACGAEEPAPAVCDHDYEVVKEDPATCTEPGYVWEKCSKCGNEYNHEIAALGGEHEYEVVKEDPATCTEPGYVWEKCSKCGWESNHEVAALGGEHEYEVVKEDPATCTESGYVWEKCSKCGWEHNHEVAALGGEHEYEVVKELAPTCGEAGYVWEKCSKCGWERNGEGAPATGEHGETYTNTFEASCVKEGIAETYCKDCDALLSKEVLPVNDNHAFYNGTCLLCGAPDCDHDGNTHLDIFEASCVKEGYSKVVCDDCGTVISTEILPVNDNHAFYNGACLLCGAPDCDHDGNTHLDIFEASCVKEGYSKVICDDCGTVISTEILPVNDNHAFYNGTCLLCGAAEPSEPEATEPEATEPEATEPEATEPEATKPAKPGVDDNQKTGDNSQLVMMGTIMVIAVLVAAAAILLMKNSFTGRYAK